MSSSQTAAVTKLLSASTVEKLDKALTKLNMEQLKKQMEKLFTFKNIFNMHDDHLIELAEFIVDLSKEENRLEYICGIEIYARRRIDKYQKRKAAVVKENQWAIASKNPDEVKMLDLSYRAWVYEEGYKYSEFHMLTMLCGIIQSVKDYEKAGGK